MAALAGPLMVLIFCLSQAFRDVYFASLFQGVDFFAVIVIAFGLSIVIFGGLTWVRTQGDFAKMRGHGATVLAMNATTALAWICYLFALKHLEPSIVNTIHSGMAPLTVVVMGALGLPLAKQGRVSRREAACYVGIAASLAGLWWVVLSGHSGLGHGAMGTSLAGVALLLVSGSSITVSLLYSKRLHDHGVSAEAVTAVRYPLIVALAAGVELFKGGPVGIGTADEFFVIAAAATLLIVLPTFALQVGVARTAPLTAQIIRALGPVCVFALEQYDQRLIYSPSTLACILAYSVFVIAGNVLHGWRDRPAAALAGRVLAPPD
jgi:drug/metabolite transporter (DMT)-like permease